MIDTVTVASVKANALHSELVMQCDVSLHLLPTISSVASEKCTKQDTFLATVHFNVTDLDRSLMYIIYLFSQTDTMRL